jgi:hypothetical protein
MSVMRKELILYLFDDIYTDFFLLVGKDKLSDWPRGRKEKSACGEREKDEGNMFRVPHINND